MNKEKKNLKKIKLKSQNQRTHRAEEEKTNIRENKKIGLYKVDNTYTITQEINSTPLVLFKKHYNRSSVKEQRTKSSDNKNKGSDGYIKYKQKQYNINTNSNQRPILTTTAESTTIRNQNYNTISAQKLQKEKMVHIRKLQITNKNNLRDTSDKNKSPIHKFKLKKTDDKRKSESVETEVPIDRFSKLRTSTNEKNKTIKLYSKIKRKKIDPSYIKNLNQTENKYRSNTFESSFNNNFSTKNNNVSTLDKRRNYVVPIIKCKIRQIKIEENSKKNEDDNKEIDNENDEKNKEMYVTQLIKNKQIEYLKDYQKYMDDCNDRVLKNNEKKLRIIQAEGYELDDLLKDNNIGINDSIDEVFEKEEGDEENKQSTNKKKEQDNPFNNPNKDNKVEAKPQKENSNSNIISSSFEKIGNEENDSHINANNNNKNNNNIKKSDNNQNNKEKENDIPPNDGKININVSNNSGNNLENNNPEKNISLLVSTKRKPKIDTLEYVFKINSEVDLNRIIKYLSEIKLNNINSTNTNTNTIIKNNQNNNNNVLNSVNENDEETEGSLDRYIFGKKTNRTKMEILEFIRNNNKKRREKAIKIKEEKDNENMKKFMNFIQLQKNIEDNKKIKQINLNTSRLRPSTLSKEKNEPNNEKQNETDKQLSQSSSSSTCLNQQEFYKNCFEAKVIFSSSPESIQDTILKSDFDNNEETSNMSQKSETNNNGNISDNNIINGDITENNKKKENKNKIRPQSERELKNENDKEKEIKRGKEKEKAKCKKGITDNDLIKIKGVIKRLNMFIDKSLTKNISKNVENNLIQNNFNRAKKQKISEPEVLPNNIQFGSPIEKNNQLAKNLQEINFPKNIPKVQKDDAKIEENQINKQDKSKQIIGKELIDNEIKKNDSVEIEMNFSDKNKGENIIVDNDNNDEEPNINEKKYNFTNEELENYYEIFNSIFNYLKLITQRNILNDIISYGDLKFRYKIGFEQLILLFKHKPFNNLRVLQQREYYQVILKQFYMPYINRAFNDLRLFVYNQQRFSEAIRIIEQIFSIIFLRRLMSFIERQENYFNSENIDKIIEEEKEDKSNDSSFHEENNENNNNRDDYNSNKKEETSTENNGGNTSSNQKGYLDNNDNDNIKEDENEENNDKNTKDENMNDNNYEDENFSSTPIDKNDEKNNNKIKNNINDNKDDTKNFNIKKIENYNANNNQINSTYENGEKINYNENINKKEPLKEKYYINSNSEENINNKGENLDNLNHCNSQENYFNKKEGESNNADESSESSEQNDNNDNIESEMIINMFNRMLSLLVYPYKQYTFNKLYEYSKKNSGLDDANLSKNNFEEKNSKELSDSIVKKSQEILIGSKNDSYSNDSSQHKYNTYLYESLSERSSSLSVFPNSEGSDKLHMFLMIEQAKNIQNMGKSSRHSEKSKDSNKSSKSLKQTDKEKFTEINLKEELKPINQREDNSKDKEEDKVENKDKEDFKDKVQDERSYENKYENKNEKKEKNEDRDKYKVENKIEDKSNSEKNIPPKEIKTKSIINRNERKINSFGSEGLGSKTESCSESIDKIEDIGYFIPYKEKQKKSKGLTKFQDKDKYKGKVIDISEEYDNEDSNIYLPKKIEPEGCVGVNGNNYNTQKSNNNKINENNNNKEILKSENCLEKDNNRDLTQCNKEKITNTTNINLPMKKDEIVRHFTILKNRENQTNIISEYQNNREGNIREPKNNNKNGNININNLNSVELKNILIEHSNEKSQGNDPYININNSETNLSRSGKIMEEINLNSASFSQSNKKSLDNKRYYLDNDSCQSGGIYEIGEESHLKEVLHDLNEDKKNKITEELVDEILKNLIENEIILKPGGILEKKKEVNQFNTSSMSNMSGVMSRENLSACSHSPGRKYNKTTSSGNLVNNNDSYKTISALSLQEEDSMNTSVFMKTIYEIKKDLVFNFYKDKILPKLLQCIENNIRKNYLSIIRNLKEPLKVNEEKLLYDIGSQINIINGVNNNLPRFNISYYNKNIIKSKFLDSNILNQVNKIHDNSFSNEEYHFQYLNQCILDAANELIERKRMYGSMGEPLLWSLRPKNIEYKYKENNFYKNIFVEMIMKELKKLINFKIGLISENYEHLNSSQFIKDREKKFNESINKELKNEKEWDIFDEQETTIKLMLTKIIMNQLLNEVVEILEHVQCSRKDPKNYNYKSIFGCENIPLLSFQSEIDVNKVRNDSSNSLENNK